MFCSLMSVLMYGRGFEPFTPLESGCVIFCQILVRKKVDDFVMREMRNHCSGNECIVLRP